MHVLITGGTGFIGSRLALALLENGDAVRVLGQANNEAEAANQKEIEANGAEVVLASVTDREQMFKLLAGIDLVYHFAAAQHEANVPDQLFYDVNVTGTKNLLDASVAAGVKRFVHGSTIGVYGTAVSGTVNEQSPLNPDNIYGVTKLEGEQLVRSYQDKLPVVIIRISETYGPGDRRLLKLFRGIRKGVFFMIGDGRNRHHLVYIDDLIAGLRLAATVAGAAGQTFILAGANPITTNEMITAVAAALETKLPRFRAPLTPFLLLAAVMEGVLRPFGIQPPLHRRRMDFFKKSFALSSDLAAAVLGFAPRIDFQQGAKETAKWYKEMSHL